jgi:glycosyltransferase involved in cell wall biosynthesis
VTVRHVDDESIDSAAIRAFTDQYGARATALPPLAIVIAAYNEEGAIGPVVEALPAAVAGIEAATIVVSDGSADGTVKEAEAAGALVCDVPVNRGQGAALRLGYRLAREGGALYIVTTDADGQYNPAEIERLLAPILADQADFVTGSRRLGSEETKDPVRKLGVRVFALAISMLTGQRISDTTFGLRAMRSEVTAAVLLEEPQYQASELLIGVITHGYRVAERPATIHKRKVGKSKKGNNAFYAMEFARVVLGTWWRERQRRARGPVGVRASGGAAGAALAPAGSADSRARATATESAASTGSADSSRAADPRSAKST